MSGFLGPYLWGNILNRPSEQEQGVIVTGGTLAETLKRSLLHSSSAAWNREGLLSHMDESLNLNAMVPILHSATVYAAPSEACRMMRRSSQHPCNHDACYSNVTPAQLTFNIIRLSECVNRQLLQSEAIPPRRGGHLFPLNGIKRN